MYKLFTKLRERERGVKRGERGRGKRERGRDLFLYTDV